MHELGSGGGPSLPVLRTELAQCGALPPLLAEIQVDRLISPSYPLLNNVFILLMVPPHPLLCERTCSLFAVLYPTGITGELGCMFQALMYFMTRVVRNSCTVCWVVY